jgi:hypothetical protein
MVSKSSSFVAFTHLELCLASKLHYLIDLCDKEVHFTEVEGISK